MPYGFIDHMADVAADLTGSTAGDIFVSAAQALTDTISDLRTVRTRRHRVRHTRGYSACHGAGRLVSRSEAKRSVRGRSLINEMRERGVHVMAAGMATVAEEMPEACKDVADVVNVVHGAGIAKRVAQLRPIGVIKG